MELFYVTVSVYQHILRKQMVAFHCSKISSKMGLLF